MLRAVGVNSGLGGWGSSLAVIDDPIANAQEAESPIVLEGLWQWWSLVMRTRATGKHPVFLICSTRWNTEDICGRLLNSPGAHLWTRLELSAVSEGEEIDPLHRPKGEPLWPEFYPVEKLPSVELGEISSRSFASLYQGHPSPKEGNVFRHEWLSHRWTTLPSMALAPSTETQILRAYGFEDDFAAARPRVVARITGLDCSAKTGVANDFSAAVTVEGVWEEDGPRFYLMDVVKARVEIPELIRLADATYRRMLPRCLAIEDSSSGIQLLQWLRRGSRIPVLPVPVTGSKMARWEAIAPWVESGRMLLPMSAPWLSEFISEVTTVPACPHDDVTDAWALATTVCAGALVAQRDRQRTMAGLGPSWISR